MKREDYHSRPELSCSDLKLFLEYPERFFKKKKGLYEKKETEAMKFGTMVHKFILEYDDFFNEYFYLDENERPVPDKDYRTKANREWRDSLKKENEGKQEIGTNDYLLLEYYKKEYDELCLVDMSLDPEIKTEESFFFEFMGVKMRALADKVVEYDEFFDLIDLKTISNIQKVDKDIKYRNYLLSLGMYAFGIDQVIGKPIRDAYLVFLETGNSNEVLAVRVNEKYLLEGVNLAAKTIEDIENYNSEKIVDLNLEAIK